MRNTYKLLAEKYMNTISGEMDPSLAEDQALAAGAPGAGEQIESEGMEHANESLYELTHDYLVSQNNEQLMHYVNRAKDLNHLLEIAIEYTEQDMLDVYAGNHNNDNAVDHEFDKEEIIEKLAKDLSEFSLGTMSVQWVGEQIHKLMRPMGESSTEEPEEKTDLIGEKGKKKEEPKKKKEEKPFAKNPFVSAVGDRWKGLSK
jgi:hypothetical protein